MVKSCLNMVLFAPRRRKRHYFSGHTLKSTKTGRRKNNKTTTYISVTLAGYTYIIHLNRGLENSCMTFLETEHHPMTSPFIRVREKYNMLFFCSFFLALTWIMCIFIKKRKISMYRLVVSCRFVSQ